MNIIKKIISYTLIVILFVLITSAIFVYLINNTLLNKEYILNSFNSSNYYEETVNSINLELSGYIEQSGLDETILEDVVTVDKVENYINDVVNNIYDNTDYEITTSIEEDLENNINKYIEDNDIYLDINQEKSVDSIISLMNGVYTSNIFPNIIVEYLPMIINTIQNYYDTYINVLIGILLFLIILQIILNKFSKSILYNCISFLSVFMFLLMLNYYVYETFNLSNVYIYNNAITSVIQYIINNIHLTLNSIGLIGLSISLIIQCGICYKIFKK